MILCSGCFDGLHIGHVRYLQAALRYRENEGEPLVVAVATDRYIHRHKGRAPIWGQMERLSTVDAIRGVQTSVLHGTDGAADAIRELKPRLFVKGRDWEHRLPEDVLQACYDEGVQIVFVDSAIPQHTSDAA